MKTYFCPYCMMEFAEEAMDGSLVPRHTICRLNFAAPVGVSGPSNLDDRPCRGSGARPIDRKEIALSYDAASACRTIEAHD